MGGALKSACTPAQRGTPHTFETSLERICKWTSCSSSPPFGSPSSTWLALGDTSRMKRTLCWRRHVLRVNPHPPLFSACLQSGCCFILSQFACHTSLWLGFFVFCFSFYVS